MIPIPGLFRRSSLIALAATAWLSVPVAVRADDLKDGRAALQGGRYEDAIKAFERAAQQGDASGRAGVGLVWLRRRQYDKAWEAFQLAQKMDPNLAMAYYGQGEVLRRQGVWDEAQQRLVLDLLGTPPELRASHPGVTAEADVDALAALVAERIASLRDDRAAVLEPMGASDRKIVHGRNRVW